MMSGMGAGLTIDEGRFSISYFQFPIFDWGGIFWILWAAIMAKGRLVVGAAVSC
jgi:hypothetical protein